MKKTKAICDLCFEEIVRDSVIYFAKEEFYIKIGNRKLDMEQISFDVCCNCIVKHVAQSSKERE
jgi:hypothetical protein